MTSSGSSGIGGGNLTLSFGERGVGLRLGCCDQGGELVLAYLNQARGDAHAEISVSILPRLKQ